VRLVGGTSARVGRLEVLHNGVWGTVCGDYFSDDAARVVCTMLGVRYVCTFKFRLHLALLHNCCIVRNETFRDRGCGFYRTQGAYLEWRNTV